MKIIFAGTPDFAVAPLKALLNSSHQVIAVYTQPDRPAGRGQKIHASPVKELALTHRIPVYQPHTLRDAGEQKTLKDLAADLMVVVAYGLLLPVPILQTPQFGCINIHASLLPRWRGAAPIQRAILAGDTEIGVTIMQMEEGLDTGPMLLKKTCAITNTDTAQKVHDRLAMLGAEGLLQTLLLIENNALHAIPQNNSVACYAPKLSKEEANLDWSQSALKLDRAVRAYNPFPIAHSYLDGQVLRIWQASPILKNIINAKPGSILHASAAGIDIATGDGILRLLRAQLPGGKALAVADHLHARASLFSPGKVLSRAP